jgi:hypothetical protein
MLQSTLSVTDVATFSATTGKIDVGAERNAADEPALSLSSHFQLRYGNRLNSHFQLRSGNRLNSHFPARYGNGLNSHFPLRYGNRLNSHFQML